MGERRLLSIARGMLRNASIVILDEATSNVDGETDTRIQDVIWNSFKGSTGLTMAHRIDTIMDSDLILVLDAGNVVEFAPPEQLLQTPGSIFGSLVKAGTKE